MNEDTGEVLGWERLDELQDEVWKRWDLGRHLRLFYFKYDMGPDWLEISFEAGKVEKKVHDRLLPFSAWEEFYSDLVKRLESKLDYPTLFSRVRPYLPRIDITFDIECEESERFIRSLHSLPMSLPLRRGFTASAQHIRAATKTAISEFSLYEPECEEGEPRIVRLEIRKKSADAVDRAMSLKKIRRTRSNDLTNYTLMRNYLVKVLKQIGIREGITILPQRIALERARHKSLKKKLTDAPEWLKGKRANQKQTGLHKKWGYVLGSVESGTVELRNLYESLMSAFDKSW